MFDIGQSLFDGGRFPSIVINKFLLIGIIYFL